MKIKNMMIGLLSIAGLVFVNQSAAITADMLFVVDESGSMGGEHAWLNNMITKLDTAMVAAGVTGNRYGLVGYGGTDEPNQLPHKHTVGGADFGTAVQLALATTGLVTSGGLEDGFQAIHYALTEYVLRPEAVVNIVLVTDEDCDTNTAGTVVSKAEVTTALNDVKAIQNSVVNGSIRETATQLLAIGHDSKGNAYFADGLGGYTVGTGSLVCTGSGSTIADYHELAAATGGAAWDLNLLRAGGLTAESFTNAFVDVKVQEVIEQVPDSGSSVLLLGVGVMALMYFRRFSRS